MSRERVRDEREAEAEMTREGGANEREYKSKDNKMCKQR